MTDWREALISDLTQLFTLGHSTLPYT